MVIHNPPLHDPDMPHHEHYATEGATKMYRPKMHDKNHAMLRKLQSENIQEHEHPYWEGRDHS